MDTDNFAKSVRRFLISAVLVIVIGLGFYLFIFKPTITVDVPAGSNVSIIDAKNNVVAQQTNTARAALHVNPGEYRVLAKNGAKQQQQPIQVGPFAQKKISFTMPSPLNLSLKAYSSAYNVVANGDSLAFLNPVSQHVTLLHAGGDSAPIDNSFGEGTRGIYAIANHQAIINKNNQLLWLHDNQLTPLSTDGLPQDYNIGAITIGTNPQKSSFVVAFEEALYFYNAPDGKPQKLVDFTKKIDQLAYGGTQVIAYSTAMPQARENIKNAFDPYYNVDPIVFDITTSTQRALSGPIVDATIAPDGQHATVEKPDKTLSLVDLSNLSTTATSIPNPSLSSPLWTANDQFIYERDTVIWRYDLAAHTLTALGQLPSEQHATSITMQDKDNFFVTTYPRDTRASIYNLSSAPLDTNAETAAAILPYSGDPNYNMSYVHINQPIVTIQTGVSVKDPSELGHFVSATKLYRQAALTYLADNHVDASKLTIIFDPADPLVP